MAAAKGMNNPLIVAKAAKPIMIGIGVLAALGLTYTVVKNFFPGGLKEDRTQAPSNITATQASVLAERLYQAMYELGTDEEIIKAVLNGLNHNDFIQVYNAFGTRSYVYLTGEAAPIDFLGADLDLVEWLIQELNTTEINELKKVLPEVFA